MLAISEINDISCLFIFWKVKPGPIVQCLPDALLIWDQFPSVSHPMQIQPLLKNILSALLTLRKYL